MKIDLAYFERLLAGEVDGSIADLGQLAEFWSVRARATDQGELQGLSRSEAIVHLTMVYVGEVGNGGHLQYFANSSGTFASEAVEALRELRETALVETLGAAIDLFPTARVPKDRSARVDFLKCMTDDQLQRFDELDHEVWPQITSVYDRALAYLQAHRDDVLVEERS